MRLTILRGLPASGKSSYAEEQLKSGNTVRVNRDDIRAMIHKGLQWSGARERVTVSVEKAVVTEALKSGLNVIVDDTNMLGAGVRLWTDFVVGWNFLYSRDRDTVTVTVKDMNEHMQVPVPDLIRECIRRDALRHGKSQVGAGVIYRMALEAGLIDLSVHDKVAVVDIDGTIADLKHRLDCLEQTPKDYLRFFDRVDMDSPIVTIIDAVYRLRYAGYTIVALSGRPDSCGAKTWSWLRGTEYMTESMGPMSPIPDYLFMRRGGDHRPDDQVKRQLMEKMFAAGLRKDAIKVIIDDRDSVCAVWRELDLPLIQVLDGAAIQIQPSALEMCRSLRIPINGGTCGVVKT